MLVAVFLVVAGLLASLGGLFAAVDAALGVLSRTDLIDLAAHRRSRRALLAISADTGAHQNAVVFVRVVAEATAAVLVSLAFATILDWWWALVVSALIMTAVSFVLVGSSPRSVGRAHARGVVAFAAVPVRAARMVLGPFADALVAIGDRVTPGRPNTQSFSSEEQLLSMVDEATELDVLEEDDRELIHSIFEFNDTVVREVMVPRTDMITIDADSTADQAMGLLLASGVSRAPVTGADVDDVRGVVYLRDLARRAFEGDGLAAVAALDLARPARFVPESKKADETLRVMQRESNHLAMVVDEYGGIAGLVTLEDLIEELVGEISDEYDRSIEDHVELSPGLWRVAARMPIDELGDLFGIELDDEDVDSVGGLLTKHVGRLPDEGSRAEASGLVLTAERTEGRRRRLRTVLVEATPALIDARAALEADAADRDRERDRDRDRERETQVER
jgi:CBS domain containing-hemolysin-like protein